MSQEKHKHTALPQYDKAFKTGAVKMVTEQGGPVRRLLQSLASAATRRAVDSEMPERRHLDRPTVRIATHGASVTRKRRTVSAVKSLRKKTMSSTF